MGGLGWVMGGTRPPSSPADGSLQAEELREVSDEEGPGAPGVWALRWSRSPRPPRPARPKQLRLHQPRLLLTL